MNDAIYRNKFRSGVIFVTLLAIISLPLSYYRNWLLSLVSADAVSTYAILLLISSVVSTFLMFGGSVVYSTFLPKITKKSDQLGFIISSTALSCIFTFIFLFILLIFPNIVISWLPENLSITINQLRLTSIFIVCFAVGQVIIYSLTGLREYKISALLTNLQIVAISVFLTVSMFFFPKLMKDNAFTALIILLSFVWLIVSVYGVFRLYNSLGKVFKFYFPTGYWNQAIYAHFGTVLTFLYNYIDQILVLTFLGTKDLAQYFLTLQLARLVSFVPQKLSAVFQTSFSSLLSQDSADVAIQLPNLYNKIAKNCLFLSFGISSFLILFGSGVLQLFGKNMSFNSLFLSLLVLRYLIGCFGSTHSMMILAHEKNSIFFWSNTVVVFVQLILSLALVKSFGVLGIISAQLISCIIGQFNLALILHKKCNVGFYKPLYFFCCIFSAVFLLFISLSDFGYPLRIVLFVITNISIMFLLRINPKEILQLKTKS